MIVEINGKKLNSDEIWEITKIDEDLYRIEYDNGKIEVITIKTEEDKEKIKKLIAHLKVGLKRKLLRNYFWLVLISVMITILKDFLEESNSLSCKGILDFVNYLIASYGSFVGILGIIGLFNLRRLSLLNKIFVIFYGGIYALMLIYTISELLLFLIYSKT